jgi:hypothetical protein
MDEKQFKQLVGETIHEAIVEAIAKKMQEQSTGTGQSGTGPTLSKDVFMKKCVAAGGNEVSCESQWQAQVSLLEEGKALADIAKRVLEGTAVNYRADAKAVMVKLSERLGLPIPSIQESLPVTEREREEMLPRLRKRYGNERT